MLSTASRQRLAALGIDVWVRRERAVADSRPAAADGPESRHEPPTRAVRVRMASGSGDWLLVQDQPWDGRHDTLLGDIQATIGAARCRFGQWADSDSAGVSITELDTRGVRHLLAFGQAPAGAEGPNIHLAPALAELAASAAARRRLWQLLAPALAQ